MFSEILESGAQAMMDGLGVLRIAREQLTHVAEMANRTIAVPTSEGASLVCVTDTDGSYPTTAQAVYVCIPQEIDADDTEGASASLTGDSSDKIYASNLGTAVPPQGTNVIVHSVGDRWCFSYDS